MRTPKLNSILKVFFVSAIFISCNPNSKNEADDRAIRVEQTAKDFFETFAERKDWEKFCSFYREDLEFEDITLQLKLDSLWQFKRFYNWDVEGDDFRKLTPDQKHLTLYSLVANDSIAVGRGRVNPFYYYDQLIDSEWGMDFTIWLYFDENLKIRKQIDWMEYDAKVLKNVIERVEKNGHEAIPDWLDLSR
ncbi:hypothetical protein [Ekhidna sp.]|uniref:hypothetical protein n=1 Tax=Ekhidna sp. TaxID=2608089 RepID=UPI003CCB8CB3